jgi:hypothetical protein
MKFSDLKLEGNLEEEETLEINGAEIHVKQYLPIAKKLEFMKDVLECASEDDALYTAKMNTYFEIYLVSYYTDIELPEDNLEEAYDILKSGIFKYIYAAIPCKELAFLKDNLKEISKRLYDYKNSIYGILDSLNKDYDNLNFDAASIQAKLSDPENLDLLKSIMQKLG